MHRFVTALRRLRCFGLRAVAAGCLIGGAASAEETSKPLTDGCTNSSTARDPEAARVAFRAGQTAFSEGGYARAVELWNQAYEDDCTAHALLLNLAMAQELLGRPEDAIQTLRLFDERSPRSPYVDANLKRIQRLQLAAAEKSRERSRRERALWAPADRPPAADDGDRLSLPLVVGVTGAAVAVVGTVLFVEGRASAAAADERCGTSRQACTSVESVIDGERARSRAEIGGWMAGAGLVTAASGLVWHFLAEPSRPLDQPIATNGVSLRADAPSRMAGLEWNGQF
jgi:tetratricopeptide (TPR) repeat protein